MSLKNYGLGGHNLYSGQKKQDVPALAQAQEEGEDALAGDGVEVAEKAAKNQKSTVTDKTPSRPVKTGTGRGTLPIKAEPGPSKPPGRAPAPTIKPKKIP